MWFWDPRPLVRGERPLPQRKRTPSPNLVLLPLGQCSPHQLFSNGADKDTHTHTVATFLALNTNTRTRGAQAHIQAEVGL